MMKRETIHTLLWAAVFCVVVFGAQSVYPQGRSEGTISGRVTDESAAVLPGVTITATNLATGLTRTDVSGPDGTYQLPALQPATYDLTATMQGFTTAKRSVQVTVGAEVTINVTLTVASIEETVTVTAESPLIEVTKTEQSVLIGAEEVENLPTNSRNFLEFAMLSPGVVRGRSSGAGWGGEDGFSSSGNRGDQNSINIDGLTNKSFNDGLENENFSQEGVQEFQVLTSSYPAEYGGGAGAVVNAVTKSGTNTLQGHVYTFFRNDAFDKPPFDLETGADGTVTAVPEESADEFKRFIGGGVAGGPIVKDKAFFFGLFERNTQNTPQVRTIPQSTIDTVREIAISTLPDDESNKVTQSEPDGTKWLFKGDFNISEKHTLAARFNYAERFSPGGTANGRNSIINSSESKGKTKLFSASVNSFLSDNSLNTVRFQYNRVDGYSDWPEQGGQGNILNFAPRIIIGGGTGGNFGRSNAGGQPHTSEEKWEVQDTFTYFKGDHTLKVGGQYLLIRFFHNFQWMVDSEWRFANVAAFEAGVPNSLLQSWGPTGASFPAHLTSFFVQDEWQPNDKVTLNLGLRYEYDRFPADISSYELPEAVINPNTGQETTAAGSPIMGGFVNDTNNLMPRVGLTFSSDEGRTVIRAAGGKFYGQNYFGEMAQGMMWNGPPYYPYDFTSGEARDIWAGTQDPTSPYYNDLGARRLPNDYFNVLLAEQRELAILGFNVETVKPYSWQANVGVERELTDWLAGSVTFLWSKGENNIRSANRNPRAGVFYRQGEVIASSGRVAPYDMWVQEGARPEPVIDGLNIGNYKEYGNFGAMSYKGLSATATVRWSSFRARVSYGYNSTWDDSVSISFRQGPSDLVCGVDCEWSRSVLSTPHRFIGSIVWQSPEAWPVAARDWQVSSIVNVEAGHPFQVWSGFDFNNETTETDRPMGVPRNSLWTDGFNSIDLRLSRMVRLGGDRSVEVLFEMFNLLNTANYDSYVDQLYTFKGGLFVPRPDFAAFANSGQLNQRDDNRSTDDIGLNTKQRRTSVGDPFQGQLGIRFRF